MPSISSLSVRARSYVVTVALVGGGVLFAALGQLVQDGVDPRWFVLLGLTIFTSSVTVKVPSVAATLSVSEAFVFTSVILHGWAAGAVLASIDGLVISYWLQHRRPQPAYRILFNTTAPALATAVAAGVYVFAGGPDVAGPGFEITQILLPLAAFAATYFLANTALIAVAISLEQGQSALVLWKNNFLSLWLNFFSGASIAALLVSFGARNGASDLGALGAIWVVLPLLGISYFTYKSSMARIEDANKHLDQLNTLYLSTIETLAMAIDAKDQITHGHIRRVQTFAVALAKAVGITDRNQIRAIEAASLLHDMGKLAVPEYILNKPGPLTPAEFERMKMHAAVGADILSAIDFPYPVVPIVRHHHENWDGGGYPAGLKGTDIPIGARILSVVDCFDALTSDRPYRPRLTDDDALQIVRERRGTMYDPLIVDTFLSLYKRLKTQPEGISIGSHGQPQPESSFPRLSAITASAGESRAMYRLIQRLAAQHTLAGALSDVADEVASLIPATFLAVYTPSADSSDLEVTHVVGSHADVLRGRRVRLGEKIVGWSASSGRSILNADPAGELGELARFGALELRSCLIVPVSIYSECVAVFAAFSTRENGFRSEDQRIIEAVLRHIGPIIERLRPGSAAGRTDQHISDALELTPVAMIACRCVDSAGTGAEPVGMALAVAREHLGADALTQIIAGNDLFVGVGAAQLERLETTTEILRAALTTAGLIDKAHHVAFAVTPRDGTNLEHLLYACRQRLSRASGGYSRVH
jgi:putative nucleotidyltransferase with HDIG domain